MILENHKIAFLIFLIVVLIISLLLLFFSYFYTINPQSDSPEENTNNLSNNYLDADLLGLGYPQKIYIAQTDKTVKISLVDNGKVVASQEFTDGLVRPSTQYSIVRLNNSSPREYIRWDQFVGPHQQEMLILTVKNDVIGPIIATDYENSSWYMPFWSSRGEVIVGDINSDGLSEVIEFADEFPPNSPRLVDEEIERITKEKFPDNVKEDMWSIISRENNGEGRGRTVIWAIYSFADAGEVPTFIKLKDDEFKTVSSSFIKVANSVLDSKLDTGILISKDNLEQDSIDFNTFVRKFWTGGARYLLPFSEVDTKYKNNDLHNDSPRS